MHVRYLNSLGIDRMCVSHLVTNHIDIYIIAVYKPQQSIHFFNFDECDICYVSCIWYAKAIPKGADNCA